MGPGDCQRRGATAATRLWLTLRHRWTDGTTPLHPTAHNTRGGDPGLRFDPLELLERLAVLTPRPRVNLILYDGVLASRAAWRAALVPATSHGVDTANVEGSVEAGEDACRAKPSRPGAYQWAELMRRPFELDVLACPRCGGWLRLPTEVPEPRPARAPPRRLETLEDESRDGPEFDAAW